MSTEEIGVLLRRARHLRGWSIAEASDRSGRLLKPSTLASYERGDRRVTAEVVVLLADLYDVPAASLLPTARGIDANDATLVAQIRGLPGTHRELLTALVDQMHRDTCLDRR